MVYGVGAWICRKSSIFNDLREIQIFEIHCNFNGLAYPCTNAPDRTFYPAEAYHQNYLALHPSQPYIAINDLPKVAALKRLFPSLYRDTPVLVAAMEYPGGRGGGSAGFCHWFC